MNNRTNDVGHTSLLQQTNDTHYQKLSSCQHTFMVQELYPLLYCMHDVSWGLLGSQMKITIPL